MTDADAVARFRGAEYRRLLAAARRSLERTGGDLVGSVSVRDPDDAERRAVIGITGSYRPEGVAQLTVRLADLDEHIRDSAGTSLKQLLETLGPPLRDRPADRARLAAAREATLRSVQGSFLHDQAWFRDWLAEIGRDGTLTRLVNAGERDRLGQAARVLEALAEGAGPVQLAELAAAQTGDTKALNHGTTLASLVLRALASKTGTARPVSTEDRRDLWDSAGVIVDDLASRVLVLNLPAAGDGLGEWLTGAAARGVPFYVTLQQLIAMPVTPVAAGPVHVCENPAVLRRAAADLGPRSRPLICTEGQPSTAFHRLAAALAGAPAGALDGAPDGPLDGVGRLRYHGDFDWPGIAIAGGVLRRHAATPWRFTAADYRAAVTVGSDYVPLAGQPQPTPWDPDLASAMTTAGRAVYEESVAASLIADLAP